MTSNTANPKAARNHARAMAGTTVDAMPILPPVARDAAGPLVWEETVAGGGYAAHRIARGTRLRLIDLHGDACASMLLAVSPTCTAVGTVCQLRPASVLRSTVPRKPCTMSTRELPVMPNSVPL